MKIVALIEGRGCNSRVTIVDAVCRWRNCTVEASEAQVESWIAGVVLVAVVAVD